MEPAKPAARIADDGEGPAAMEPMLPGEGGARRGRLADLVVDLVARANRLAGRLSPPVRDGIGDLVRSMNCYYSNLIEGHDTHPVDIEKALKEDFSADPRKRDLQREAVAHIEVQRLVDEDAIAGRPDRAAYAVALHKAFRERLPDDLLWVADLQGGERVRVVPGALRDRTVVVGRHVPVSPGAIARFLARWEEAYALERHDKVTRLIAVGAAHHRFAWIHPFIDGNGRVVRLVSHAMLRALDVGNPLWSISRGLARGVDRYKALLAAADEPRRGDLDGRGALSETALADFCAFFLETCIDQIDFMERLIEPDRLLARIERHAAELVEAKKMHRSAPALLRAVFLSGEIARGEVRTIIDASDRTASRVVSDLIQSGMLHATTHKASLRLGFPAVFAERWLPGLFPAFGGGSPAP